ncbi:hypothetical protein Pan189_21780 [Stratiformator vulcanicus]|uniref:Uncharacterized protein n=1 Tax=Stratiformator vulcanicus TaxID=2527980 RepID=A0A517R1P8_9PLAN|nr:hypothetical protein Pan189_21780 [Stratiformator vulcanicus]
MRQLLSLAVILASLGATGCCCKLAKIDCCTGQVSPLFKPYIRSCDNRPICGCATPCGGICKPSCAVPVAKPCIKSCCAPKIGCAAPPVACPAPCPPPVVCCPPPVPCYQPPVAYCPPPIACPMPCPPPCPPQPCCPPPLPMQFTTRYIDASCPLFLEGGPRPPEVSPTDVPLPTPAEGNAFYETDYDYGITPASQFEGWSESVN